MRVIRFTAKDAGCDRRHFLTEEDILVVLGRLPEEDWSRLRAVHFNDRGRGVRWLGYANSSHREITICALPPRVSLARFPVRGQSCAEFGARRGAQWPDLAVRRFLLYDVFLHEIGHLQMVDGKSRSARLKFAREKLAESYAADRRRELWSAFFDHPDPVHNSPRHDRPEPER